MLKLKPILWSYLLQPEGSDREEVFKDVPEDKGEGNEEDDDDEEEVKEEMQNNYILTKRDPLYCKAELSTPWEFSRVCVYGYIILIKVLF